MNSSSTQLSFEFGNGMISGSTHFSSNRNSGSTNLNTVVCDARTCASIKDSHTPVIFSSSAFHRENCKYVGKSKNPVFGYLYESFFVVKYPCGICWGYEFRAWWKLTLRSMHINCSPHSVVIPQKAVASQKIRKLGRPRSLQESTLERVLSRGRDGLGYQTIVQELRGAGIDVSRAAVQRAIKRKPPYDDSCYDEIYERYSGNHKPIDKLGTN